MPIKTKLTSIIFLSLIVSSFLSVCVGIVTSPKCGINKQNVQNRILGGHPTGVGTWPWLAAVLGSKVSEKVRLCGGSLISQKHVLTAAHCYFEGAQVYVVRLGAYDIWDLSGKYGANAVDYKVEKWIIHEKFARSIHYNDIAILVLDQEIQFTDNIQPICLPSHEFENYDLVGSKPYIAGWGELLREGSGHFPNVIHEAQVPIVSIADCKRALDAHGYTSKIDEKTLCAGYEHGGVDSCKFDSGGPMMLDHDDVWYLIGIISNGFGCGRPREPGVYMNVAHYLPWIRSKIDH